MFLRTDKKGFYCASDTVFFNEWSRLFVLSAQRHAPWANIRVHVYDGTQADREWCQQHGVEYSAEPTPEAYCEDLQTRRGYWVCHRFCRVPDLFADTVPVWCVDADSVFHRDMTESEYDAITAHSWVNVWGEPNTRSYKTIGYAVSFSAGDTARHELSRRLLEQDRLSWYQDQEAMDGMLIEGLFKPEERTHSNHVCSATSYIWTGKGDRKYVKTSALTTYPGLALHYKKLLEQQTKYTK
jgi:hypothetical protein